MPKADTKKKPASSATRAESIRAFQAARTPEERAESARKAQAARTPEQRAEAARKAAAARAANREAKAKRQAAAAKGIETKRQRYPERFKEPMPQKAGGKKRGKKAQSAPKAKDPRRVAAGLKGAETRRKNEAARLAAAQSMRAQLDREKREERQDWRSEFTYISGPGIGTLAEWARELIAAVVDDTRGQYQPNKDERKLPPGLERISWRVKGSVEGATRGAGTFDVTISGTLHERIVQLIAAIVAAAERGGVVGKDDSPLRRGKLTGGGGKRAAVVLDSKAEQARQEAVARYSEQGDKERQAIRIETMTAPEYSATWGGAAPGEEDEPDDEVPF